MARKVLRGWDPARLKKLRERKRRPKRRGEADRGSWTEADLARKSGVSVQTIRNWECDRSQPTVDKLRAVAQALGVGMDQLVKVSEHKRHLSDLRVLAGLTQPEAAKEAGISTGFYADVERAEAALTDQIAKRLATIFATDAETVRAAWQRAHDREPGEPA